MNMFHNILARLKASSFWKSVATLSAGQIIGQAIGLLSTPIASRLYSVDAYGNFGIITSTATIIIGLIGLGLGSAIMAPSDDEESKCILRTSFILQAVLATLVVLSLLLISNTYRPFETDVPYWLAILFMYVYILATILNSYMAVYINKLGKNKVLFVNPLISACCTLGITIPLGFKHMETAGLMCASIVSPIIASLHMIKSGNPFNKKFHISDVRFVFKKYKDFVLYQYPANCVTTFAGQIPNQTISGHYGSNALGSFSMCNKVFSLPTNVIATPIQTVYFRTAAEKYRAGEDISAFTYSMLTKFLYIGFLPVLFAMCFGEPIFSFVLGRQWAQAGTLASILALYFAFSFCYNCVTYFRVAVGRQKINAVTSIISLIALGLPLLLGVLLDLGFYTTMLWFAIANTIWQILNCAINFWCMKSNAAKWLIFSIVYCCICIGITVAVRQFI